jgi:hypothetical protein
VNVHRVLITGDRNGVSEKLIEHELGLLKALHPKLIIIGGGAPGVDTQCKLWCYRNSVHFAEVKALWDTRHRGAGPQRNAAMLWLQPHEVHAFHHKIAESRGTKDMIKQATNAGVPVVQVHS